jgi:hypothetical protein
MAVNGWDMNDSGSVMNSIAQMIGYFAAR